MSTKIKWGLLACAAFLLLIIGLGLATQLQNDHTNRVTSTQKQPLILIPGSDSSPHDFDALVQRLNTQHQHPIVRLTITAQHTMQFKETRTKDSPLNDTIIVLHYQHSTDTNATIIEQTQDFAKALTYLKQRLQLKQANALGYSNGGLILTRYVAGLTTAQPVRINNLMLLGTPFLGTNPKHPDRTLFQPLLAHKTAFKTIHSVVNVAGDTGQGSDHVVPTSSVTAGQQLFMNQATRYTQMTVNHAKVNHADLLNDPYVARLVRQNLLHQ